MIDCDVACPYENTERLMGSSFRVDVYKCIDCKSEQLQKAEAEVGRLTHENGCQYGMIMYELVPMRGLVRSQNEEIDKLKDVHQKEITALVEQLEWYNGGDSFVIRRLKEQVDMLTKVSLSAGVMQFIIDDIKSGSLKAGNK